MSLISEVFLLKVAFRTLWFGNSTYEFYYFRSYTYLVLIFNIVTVQTVSNLESAELGGGLKKQKR